METFLLELLSGLPRAVLETFLGGMETPRLRRSANVTSETLKPSLVEWKRLVLRGDYYGIIP